MRRGSLFRKYTAYFAGLVTLALLVSGVIGMYVTFRDNKSALLDLQREKASAAASRIQAFAQEIEHQIGWLGLPQPGVSTPEERRFECLKLLRLVPSVTDLAQIDREGLEVLRVSRLSMNVSGSREDFSKDPRFTVPKSGKIYFSPVYFRKETEPYITISMAGLTESTGIVVAEVNLKFILDVITRIKIGEKGLAYVVDSQGRLIAHPDISQVLKKRDLSSLVQVKAALGPRSQAQAESVAVARNADGAEVLTAFSSIEGLGWHVFVEQPIEEAFAPLNGALKRTGILLLGGLAFSLVAGVFLARRMVEPIRAVQAGAARIGAGTLDQSIEVKTGDELEALAEQFNSMAGRLKESYSVLERKVEERTRELSDALGKQTATAAALDQRSQDLSAALNEAEVARKAADEHSAEAEAERKRAEAANQAKSVFLANMSHELRTPLNAVIGFAQLMDRDRSLAKENREHLGIILRSGEHLLGLINDVLSLSKIEAGRVTLTQGAFELQPFLNGLSEMMQARAEAKGLDLLFKAKDLPRGAVLGDDSKLRQLLINLVGNAIKFTKKGHVALRASWREERAVFEVEDTGPGMTPAEREQLFQPFVQTETGEKAREGTGLGLAISRRFARLMGGDISVESAPGTGTTFVVTVDLPLAAGGAPGHAGERARKVVRLASGQDLRILVVDDILENRLLLGKLLESVGFEVRQAANGQQAVDLWRTYRPHLIWMDMRMPVMDGLTATRLIREAEDRSEARVKIVALSASALDHERAAVKSLGCDDFLAKPYRESAIFEKLAEHLGARFEYESGAPGESGPAVVEPLSAGRLFSLDPAVRRPLHEALRIGDDAAAMALVAGIRSVDPGLGEILAETISRFQVDDLLGLLEELEGKEA